MPAPRGRSLHQSPRFVPADPQDPRRAAHITLTQHVEGQALEEQREPRPRRCPRHQDLHHAPLAAGHAGECAQAGTSRTGNCPDAARSARRRGRRAAVSSRIAGTPTVRPPCARPHVHALPVEVQVHSAHRPWPLQAQQVLIERGVLHGGLRVRPTCYPFRLPMRNPEAPIKISRHQTFPE
jgi:hypothetical protein